VIRPGLLSSRLTLEAPERVADGAGGATVTWIVEDALWAHVAAQTGRASLSADAAVSAVTYRVTLRHRAGITAEKRFVWGARILSIHAVLDDGEGRWIVCLCEEEKGA